MSPTIVSGSCNCGQLSFTSSKLPAMQAICHCTDCRAATGDLFTIAAFFRSDSITFSGDTESKKFTSGSGASTTRESCPGCKSVMIDRSDGVPHLIGVVTRYIAPPFQAEPVCHMWLRSKASDVTINDGLTQHQERIRS